MNHFDRLAEVLRTRESLALRGSAAPAAELGSINSDYSLSVKSLQTPIPKGDYLLPLPLSAGNMTDTADRHTHTVPSLRGLRPGDRVLVLWADGEPVVAAIVS